jgi:hypothetical protein
MKQTIIALVMAALLASSLSAATTVKGRAGTSGEKSWGFIPFGDGQTMITLSWPKRSADMFMVLSCVIDGEEIIFGTGAALQDRIQRIEAGAFGDTCFIGVSSFRGSSSFRLSVESGIGDDLAASSVSSPNGDGAALRGQLVVLDAELTSELAPELLHTIHRLRQSRSIR